jgi:hypothetical protein
MSNSITLTIKIEGGIVLACGTVLVHNAFSPNGDGVNEMFTIDNIDDTIVIQKIQLKSITDGVLVLKLQDIIMLNAFNGISWKNYC